MNSSVVVGSTVRVRMSTPRNTPVPITPRTSPPESPDTGVLMYTVPDSPTIDSLISTPKATPGIHSMDTPSNIDTLMAGGGLSGATVDPWISDLQEAARSYVVFATPAGNIEGDSVHTPRPCRSKCCVMV